MSRKPTARDLTDADAKAGVALAILVRRTGVGVERPRLVTAIRDVLNGSGASGVEEEEAEDGWLLEWFAPPLDVVRAAEAVRQRFGWHAAVGIGVAHDPRRARQLARGASSGLISIDVVAYEAVRLYVLRRPGGATDYVVATGRAGASGGSGADWQTGVQTAGAIIGAAAGLAVWTALVGGATMWARLHRADVPETQGVAVLPQEVLVGVGLHVLVVMLLFAAPLAVFAAVLSPTGVEAAGAVAKAAGGWAKTHIDGTVITGRLLLGGVVGAGFAWFAFSDWFDVEHWALAVIAAVAAATLALLYVAFLRLGDRRLARGLAVFAIVLASAGVIGALREFGSRSVRLDRAEVMLESESEPSDALFIARTGDTLYVARDGDSLGCRIEVIPVDSVRVLRIREYRRDKTGCADRKASPAPPSEGGATTTITEPARTVTVANGTVTITPATVTLPPERVTVQADTVTLTETREVERPAGARRLDDGRWTIPVESVRPPLRLAISAPRYSRSPLRDTSPLRATFRITAVRGYVVEGARVYVRALRAKYFEPAEATSDSRGFAQICLRPRTELPFGPAVRLALFVRVWNPNEPVLAGTSQRRLVQLHLGPRATETSLADC